MVKKLLSGGKDCGKCAQAEKILRTRGYWEQLDEVVVAVEDDPASEGMKLAAEYGVDLAPFFLVHPDGGESRVYTKVFEFIKKELETRSAEKPGGDSVSAVFDVSEAAGRFAEMEPPAILAEMQGRFGEGFVLAFSGAEDVALVDMAWRNRLPFGVFCLDTGRLHPETYRFIDTVRERYGVVIEVFHPAPHLLEPLVAEKGLHSFYRDGHAECCGIRKVEPLSRALSKRRAWASGLRRDQSPATRGNLPLIAEDEGHQGADGRPLVKVNPLLNWSSDRLWSYIRENDVPYNPLHDAGYRSIGCEPCTRPSRPGEHERMARWWWEDSTLRECGLHVRKSG